MFVNIWFFYSNYVLRYIRKKMARYEMNVVLTKAGDTD